MSDTVDQEQAAKPEPVASVASEILPSAREDNPAHHREKTEVQQDFFASRGFKKFAAVLFTLLVLVLCSSALTGLAKSSTESFATSILTLFGVLITGIFVFMALRIDSGARKEAQTIAHAEARDQAEFAARLIAPEEARRVAVDVAKSVARDESRKVAEDVARDAAKVEAAREARKTAGEVADDVAKDVAKSAARDAARDVAKDIASGVAREVAQDEFNRIIRIISESRPRRE